MYAVLDHSEFLTLNLYEGQKTILIFHLEMEGKAAQSCLTVRDGVSREVPCSALKCPWDSLGKHAGVGGHPLLQGIRLTQGSNPGDISYVSCINRQILKQ